MDLATRRQRAADRKASQERIAAAQAATRDAVKTRPSPRADGRGLRSRQQPFFLGGIEGTMGKPLQKGDEAFVFIGGLLLGMVLGMFFQEVLCKVWQ